jgi:hypothetical protein
MPLLLQINENHAFFKQVLEGLDPAKREAVEICLAGWARMEKGCVSKKRKQQLQMARKDWGQLLTDFLDEES